MKASAVQIEITTSLFPEPFILFSFIVPAFSPRNGEEMARAILRDTFHSTVYF